MLKNLVKYTMWTTGALVALASALWITAAATLIIAATAQVILERAAL